jgi:aldehyde dehydrogenase (NAD+)
MMKMADLIEKNVERLAKFETMCMGQPISVAMKIVSFSPGIWRYYAGFCDKIQGESFPEDGDARVKITQYMPYGVCASIGVHPSLEVSQCVVLTLPTAAWNGTQITAAKKIAPAIAAVSYLESAQTSISS